MTLRVFGDICRSVVMKYNDGIRTEVRTITDREDETLIINISSEQNYNYLVVSRFNRNKQVIFKEYISLDKIFGIHCDIIESRNETPYL
jgi:hypothetical protein